MKMKKKKIKKKKMRISLEVFFILIFLNGIVYTQSKYRLPQEVRKTQVSSDEIVSMTKSMAFNQALEILSIFNKKFLGKIIIDPENRTNPIGINIVQEHWLEALEMILKANELWYEEHVNYIKIIPLSAVTGETKDASKISIMSREVVISAVFFEANSSKLRQMGLSWDFFRNDEFNIAARMSGASNKTGLLEVEFDPNLDFGSLLTIIKALESEQIGEVVASPQITVRSNQNGTIQVGSDIAVTVKDFAGNSVTKFFSTGAIIKVKPEVIKHDSINFIHLTLDIERSNTSSGSVGLEIKKSKASTSVLLLDGEETVIGGLYVNEETKSREGVPFLKDLPWWFLGLRYAFGFDSKIIIKKELIILIKAELLPTLQERLLSMKMRALRRQPTLLQKRLQFKKLMEFYQKQSKPLE